MHAPPNSGMSCMLHLDPQDSALRSSCGEPSHIISQAEFAKESPPLNFSGAVAGSMLAITFNLNSPSITKMHVWNPVMVSPHLSTHNNATNGSLLPSLLYATLWSGLRPAIIQHVSRCQLVHIGGITMSFTLT